VQAIEPKRSGLLLALVAAVLAVPGDLRSQGPDKELDTPYVPTPQVVVKRMLDLARVKSGDTVIDLGSGDGRIMITAAQAYGARGFGVEIDPRLVQSSNEDARRAGVADRVKFLKQDLFTTDFREADVLTLYLLPDVNMALRPKILAELKAGTRVVSHDYDMGVWRPDAQETIPAPDKTVGARKESTVYLWIVPAKVEGAWELDIHAGGKTRRYPLLLEQQYQVVSGSVTASGKAGVPITRGALRGEEISIDLPGGIISRGPVKLTGRVKDGTLAGSVRRGDREIATWSARRRS
jgi:methyltransferase family protein